MTNSTYLLSVVGECDGRYLVVSSVPGSEIPSNALAVQVDLTDSTIESPHPLANYLELGTWHELSEIEGEHALQKLALVFDKEIIDEQIAKPLRLR